MFSAFPDRAAGAGLLLLRVVLGGITIADAATGLGAIDERTVLAWVVGPLSVVSGAALAVGLFTPAAAAGAAIGTLLGWICFPPGPSWLAPPAAQAFYVANGIAIILLGPGAYSVDARLFGRHEITIPRGSGMGKRS